MLKKILGVRWDSFARNTDIRNMLCQTTDPVKLRSARMKWLEHIDRMGEERQRKRLRGKPQTKWKDVLQRELEESGLSFEEAAAEAQNRDL